MHIHYVHVWWAHPFHSHSSLHWNLLQKALSNLSNCCGKGSSFVHVSFSVLGIFILSVSLPPSALSPSRADSVVWNAHKCLHVPQQCSAFLTRHEDKLKACNSTGATYLFQQDKLNYKTTYDTGDKSFQCGRLNDAFKFWLMWKQKVRYRFIYYWILRSKQITFTNTHA